MRQMTVALIALLLAAAPLCAHAGVVDASAAEAAYKAGDYERARELFSDAVAAFRTASKDSSDHLVYREAAYLYDRLADCSFVIRDWDALKEYCDGLLVVSLSERNLTEEQLGGALSSGIAAATARYLARRLDESVRINTIVQAKRSVALVLYDTRGEGEAGAEAIRQYQNMAAACVGVYEVEDGAYRLNVPVLEERLGQFDLIIEEVSKLADLDALWEKYPPESKQRVEE